MKRTMLILFAAILILSFIFIYPVLFQEGNPIPILKAIIELTISDNEIVKISNNPKRYISKTSSGNSPLIGLMEKEGWQFDEQLGSGFFFSKDSNNLTVTGVQYTGKYRIWKITN